MDLFSNALSGDKDIKDRVRMATNKANSIVVGSDAENDAVIIHSLSNLGGNILHPTDNIVGIVGMGCNPIGVSTVIDSFCKRVKQNTPGLEKYNKCTSTEQIAALERLEQRRYGRVKHFLYWHLSWSNL